MAEGLAGRVVLVTGSSRGIGAEVAVKAAAEGASVAIHYHRSAEGAQHTLERVRATGAGVEAEAFTADLTDGREAEGLVERVIARFGRIDGLVNNAGRTQVGPFLEITPQEWDAVLRTDLTAAFHTCRAVLPSMVERGTGTIVNVASRLAQIGIAETAAYSAAKSGLVGLTRALAKEFGPRGIRVNIASRLAQMGIAETAAYSAAKSGLVGLTRALAREFGPRGIRVNAVAPGMTLTDMTTDLAESEEGTRRLRDMPLGRFGRADEVAEAVIFLLSDRSSLFLGQTLNPNAGGYMP